MYVCIGVDGEEKERERERERPNYLGSILQ